MALEQIAIIAFSDMTAVSGNPLTSTSTTGASGTFAVNSDADPIQIQINDDDDFLEDAFQETGAPQTLAAPVTINGTTYPIGAVVELEFKVTTADGQVFSYLRIDGDNVGLTGPTLPQPDQVYSITGSSDGQEEAWADIACFTAGIYIDTPRGPCLIEQVQPGDLVLTRDNGPQIVRWVGQTTLGVDDLTRRPGLRPVQIMAGVMGNSRDFIVSPQHRILFDDWRAQIYFGTDSVLSPAIGLVNGQTVKQLPATAPVTYVHLFFDCHQIVTTDGVASESLYPGDYVLDGHSSAAIDEFLDLFPELNSANSDYGPVAYPALRARETSLLSESRMVVQ